MFLSTIKGNVEIDAVNMDFLMKSFTAQGFTVLKQKNKDLEAGLNTVSFHIEKNTIYMAVFVMKIDKNLYMCAGYHNGKLLQEREVKYQSDVPSIILNIFNSIKLRREDEPILFDLELQNVRAAAERIQQRQKNVVNFTQELKTSPAYEDFKKMQKKANQKIISDTECIINNRDYIKQKNDTLIEPLLRVEACKQSLQSVLLAYEQESQYLSNVKERLKEQIETVKSKQDDVVPEYFSETSLKEFIQHLTKLKKSELQLKHLAP